MLQLIVDRYVTETIIFSICIFEKLRLDFLKNKWLVFVLYSSSPSNVQCLTTNSSIFTFFFKKIALQMTWLESVTMPFIKATVKNYLVHLADLFGGPVTSVLSAHSHR